MYIYIFFIIHTRRTVIILYDGQGGVYYYLARVTLEFGCDHLSGGETSL
jgi:hypothetical protein